MGNFYLEVLEDCNKAFVKQFDGCSVGDSLNECGSGHGSNTAGNTFGITTDTVTSWDEFYQWRQPYDHTPVNDPTDYYKYHTVITEIEEKPKKEKNMKVLYHVIVIDLDEKILVDEKKVAENEDDAKFLAGVFSTLETAKLKPTEVTIIVNSLGSVKVRPKVKEVKVKKDE